jgi:curli biogenesis system outer membrane secretion channel CsgG
MKKFLMGLMIVLVVSGFVTVPAGSAAAPVSIPAPSGNLKYTITVSKFKNEAGWHGQWNVGDGFTTIMTDSLQQSGWFVVLGDKGMRNEAMAEQDLAARGRTAKGKKTAKIGYMTPAQLLVRGSITHVQNKKAGSGGGLSFKGIRLGGSKGKAEINITMYIVDSETGQVKASTKVVGTSKSSGMKFGYHGSALGGLRGDMGGFKSDNLGKACEDAVAKGILFLIEQLEGIPWEGTVISASSGKIIINRGTREGVAVGDKFDVGEPEEVRDPDTGEVLDVEIKKIATLQVIRVKKRIAYCKSISGKGAEKGMTVMPAQ